MALRPNPGRDATGCALTTVSGHATRRRFEVATCEFDTTGLSGIGRPAEAMRLAT